MTEATPNTPATVATAEAIASGREPSSSSTLPKTAQALAEKEKDLIALRDAAVEAASVSGPLWITYLGALFYLAIAAGAVTHKDLFLENPVKLPFLNVELPLTGFFGLGPAFFLILHTYVLLHFVLLAGKVGAFHRELNGQMEGNANEERRANLRRQLPSNIFIQFLAGPQDVRFGLTGWLLRGIAWISLVFGPVLLLVFFQLRFLPYHHAPLTWWHRIAVLLDILLLWWFWPKIAMATLDDTWRHRAVRYTVQSAAVLPLALVFCVASFPGERLHTAWQPVRFIPVGIARALPGVTLKSDNPELPRTEWASLHELLLDGSVDQVARRPTSPFANVLVLPGVEAYDPGKFDEDKKFAAVAETRSLRGRHLEGAVLIGARLRKVDLTGAFLQGAVLDDADLREARLVCADRGGGTLEGCTQLQNASLNHAQLQGAKLDKARLQGVSFTYAKLHGASLVGAQLHGATLAYAVLPGASLESAQLQGAWLFHAQMQGTSLSSAHMQGASLRGTGLQGAMLSYARLQGAQLDGTQLQGASLDGAQLQGATLDRACLWRADARGAETTGTRVTAARRLAINPLGPGRPQDDCDWTGKQSQMLRAEFERVVPVGGIRDVALWRFDNRLLADTPAIRQAEAESAVHWQNLEANPPSDASFVAARRAAGCNADNAPYVTRGLLRQIGRAGPQTWEAPLAAALLDPATCPGTAKLTDDDKAQLARIRDFKPTPTQ